MVNNKDTRTGTDVGTHTGTNTDTYAGTHASTYISTDISTDHELMKETLVEIAAAYLNRKSDVFPDQPSLSDSQIVDSIGESFEKYLTDDVGLWLVENTAVDTDSGITFEMIDLHQLKEYVDKLMQREKEGDE